MNRTSLKVWSLATINLAFIAALIRLLWQIPYASAAGTVAIIMLAALGLIGVLAFLIYFMVNPSLKKLSSTPVTAGIAIAATSGLISGIIHFIRFAPSPEAAQPLSIVIASLYLLAGFSAYLLLLWILRSIRKAGKG